MKEKPLPILIKIRSFDPLPYIATRGSKEIPVQSCKSVANQKTACASAYHCYHA